MTSAATQRGPGQPNPSASTSVVANTATSAAANQKGEPLVAPISTIAVAAAANTASQPTSFSCRWPATANKVTVKAPRMSAAVVGLISPRRVVDSTTKG